MLVLPTCSGEDAVRAVEQLHRDRYQFTGVPAWTSCTDEFTIEDLRQAVPGASDSYLSKTLARMRDAGIVASQPAGRGSRWRRLRTDL